MRKMRGFTLVELLVVISIIALLLSILLPSLNKARESATKTVCKSNIKQLGVGVYMYMSDSRKMPDGRPGLPDETGAFERHFYRMISGGPANFADFVGLGMLYPKYIQDPIVFWCPANRKQYDGHSVTNMVADMKKGAVGQSVSSAVPAPSSYMYRKRGDCVDPPVKSPFLNQIPNPSRFAMIADSAYSTITPVNHKDGYNTAFFDTHVEWTKDKGNKLFINNSTATPQQRIKWSNKGGIKYYFYNADKIDYTVKN